MMPLVFRNKNGCSYFEVLLNEAKPILEQRGLIADIEGFEETMNSLNSLTISDVALAWKLCAELNAWSDYLSDMRSNCNKILKDLEVEKKLIVAEASLKADKGKVANGDRLANKDKDVVKVRKDRNVIESLVELLNAKIEYLERGHYLCKKTFELPPEYLSQIGR